MTTLDQTATMPQTRLEERRRQLQQPRPRRARRRALWTNVGRAERVVSVAAGAILAGLGISRRSIPGWLIAGAGGALIFRGAAGHSFAYAALGVDTTRPQEEQDIAARGVHVEQAFLISKSPEELYGYWRNFANLPRIMSHLHRVDVLDDRRSHWVASAPRIVGGKVEWDAEITHDEPNTRIAWRSLPGSDVDTVGEIRFSPAMGERGTEVHVFMDYVPPAGQVGHWIATLFGKSPQHQMREDLRRFKQLMETGEIPTIIGQPHGTCTGTGERYKE